MVTLWRCSIVTARLCDGRFREGIAWHGSVMAWRGTERCCTAQAEQGSVEQSKGEVSRGYGTAHHGHVLVKLSVVTVPLGETLFCIGDVRQSGVMAQQRLGMSSAVMAYNSVQCATLSGNE